MRAESERGGIAEGGKEETISTGNYLKIKDASVDLSTNAQDADGLRNPDCLKEKHKKPL